MSEERLMRRIKAANPVPQLGTSADRDAIFASIVAQPGHQTSAAARRPRLRLPHLGRLQTLAGGSAVAGVAAITVALAGSGTPSTLMADGVTVSGAHLRETADIIRHVRTDLASTGAGSVLMTTTSNPTSSGTQQSVSWAWTDPESGVQYERSTTTDASGNPVDETWSAISGLRHDANGQVTETGQSIYIDYTSQTYSKGPMQLTYTPAAQQPPGILSSTSQITQALKDGTVSQNGTSTVNGTPAIALSVTGEVGMTLYVDAQTYQPLQVVFSNPANSDNEPITTDIESPSSSNIANTDAPAIPSSFTADPGTTSSTTQTTP